MKKVVAIAVAIALCVSLCIVLAACGASEDAESEYEEEYDEEEYDEEEYDEEYDEEEYDEEYDEEEYDEEYDEEYGEASDVAYESEDNNAGGGNAGGGNAGGTFYSGMAGDESTIFAVCLSVSPDGTQCVFAVGNPGSSQITFGRYIANRNSITIKPLDGGDEIFLKTSDNADGSISIEFVNQDGEMMYDGIMESVSEAKFNETLDMLS